MNDSHPRAQDHATPEPERPEPADERGDTPSEAAETGAESVPEAVQTPTSGSTGPEPVPGPSPAPAGDATSEVADEPSGGATAAGDTDADAAEPDEAGESGEPELDLAALADADPRTRVELFGALLSAEAQRDEYLDDLRRARAEFENYRRRVMREGATQRDAGKGEVVTALLEVLDDLDRTLDAADASEDPSLAKGVQLVASKLTSALGSQGLHRIDAVEEPFDPNQHEAVQQQESDEPLETPIVTQVLRPGYRLGDRVLRPAMVVVAS